MKTVWRDISRFLIRITGDCTVENSAPATDFLPATYPVGCRGSVGSGLGSPGAYREPTQS